MHMSYDIILLLYPLGCHVSTLDIYKITPIYNIKTWSRMEWYPSRMGALSLISNQTQASLFVEWSNVCVLLKQASIVCSFNLLPWAGMSADFHAR